MNNVLFCYPLFIFHFSYYTYYSTTLYTLFKCTKALNYDIMFCAVCNKTHTLFCEHNMIHAIITKTGKK